MSRNPGTDRRGARERVHATIHLPDPETEEGPDFETVPGEREDGKTAEKTAIGAADSPGKSGGKSGVGQHPGTFLPGHDPRRGQGPLPGSPNAGRPPSAVREAMRLAAAQRVPVLEAIADDPECNPGDRIRAVDTLAKHGLGQMIEIGMDDVQRRLRATLVLLSETLPDETFNHCSPNWRRSGNELLAQGGTREGAGPV